MTQWFGVSWDAPINDIETHITTPVGAICEGCEKAVEADDRGVAIPYVDAEIPPPDNTEPIKAEPTIIHYHIDCLLDSILGDTHHIFGVEVSRKP